MSRLKSEILSKLKEYAGKMGKDHLGGDDIESPSKGGLRDFDGYDNVQYNKDMPMDEDSPESAHPQGSKKLTNRTTVMDMLDVISHKEFGPDYHKLSTKDKKEVHKLAIKGKLIKQSQFKEMKVSETTLFGEFLQEGIESVNEGKVDRVVGHTRYKYVGDGRKGKAIVSGPMKDREKEAIIKRAKKAGYNAKPNMGGGVTIHVESVNEATSKYPNFDLNKNIRYQDTVITKGMWRYTGRESGGAGVYRNLNNNQFLGFSSDDFKYFKKHLKRHFDIDESVNESTSKEAMGIAGFTGTRGNAVQKFIDDYNLDARKLFNFVKKGKLKDRMQFVSAIAGKPGNKFQGKMVGMFGESVNESMFSMIDQIRQDSKDVRDFVKNVFKDREFKKMSNDKEFIKYLKSIYEGINEAIPQNFHQGRTSDYHTALRGKNRDYSGGTNFKKKNHGQPDVEEDDEDQETNHLSNQQLHVKAKLKVAESGKKKSEKNYKDWKNTNEGFDKVEHLSLLNKALRASPGSNKQKDIIRQLNVIRKTGGMRPLKELSIVEYGQRLDLSFIEDEEAKLDGTYPSTDAIDRDIDESLKDMVGDTYTFSIGSGDEKWIKPNTKEYVIEKIAETIKHNLYDWDFSLNGIDGSQAKEYSKIFDNDVLKPLLRNIDKTLKTYFKIDSKNKKISWKLSFRDNDKIIDAFFKKNKKISSDIRDSYFSQNEAAKRDYKDEYKKFQSSTKSKKYRAELNKYNRDKGTYGNGDGKDASHKGGKIVGFESQSKNRGRKEKSRLKKK